MLRLLSLLIVFSVIFPVYKCEVDVRRKTKVLGGYKVIGKVKQAADDKKDDKDEKDEKKIDYNKIKSGGGSWTPAFVYRNGYEYEKYRNGTIIEKEDYIKDLLTKKVNDLIIFQEQCLSDTEFDFLKNLSDHIKDKIFVVKAPEIANAVHLIQNISKNEDFSDVYKLQYKGLKVPYPYITMKRNELQLDSNKSRSHMENQIYGFVNRYETTYEAFTPLIVHYTWIRLHMHTWPVNLTMELRMKYQRKHFKIIFEKFIRNHRSKHGRQFIIYTSDSTYCHGGQMKKPTEIWTMEDKRWGSTTIWCRAHHVLLQVADMYVLYPNEVLVKPKGPRHCETTVYTDHMVVAMRIDQYSTDIDLFFDIKLPSRSDAHRTYTVERCYLQGRKYEGHEFNRKLEYLPKDDANQIQETFSNTTARRIVFLVEGGLQDYCRVKKVFDWMAFAKKICVMMILIALPMAILFLLALLIIRLRFYLYQCFMCAKDGVNINSIGKASAGGAKRLCTPVGHLIGIGAYLLQRSIYNMSVKAGGGQRGGWFSSRLGRAREYTAQHIGNVAIYFIQGLVTISVVRAITLVAATLLEIS